MEGRVHRPSPTVSAARLLLLRNKCPKWAAVMTTSKGTKKKRKASQSFCVGGQASEPTRKEKLISRHFVQLSVAEILFRSKLVDSKNSPVSLPRAVSKRSSHFRRAPLPGARTRFSEPWKTQSASAAKPSNCALTVQYEAKVTPDTDAFIRLS